MATKVEILKNVKETIKSLIGNDNITLESIILVGSGMDTLNYIELCILLEDDFKILIDENKVIEDGGKIKDLVNYCFEKIQEKL